MLKISCDLYVSLDETASKSDKSPCWMKNSSFLLRRKKERSYSRYSKTSVRINTKKIKRGHDEDCPGKDGKVLESHPRDHATGEAPGPAAEEI
jgi:hypothetical protein